MSGPVAVAGGRRSILETTFRAANTVFAGPPSGVDALPTFRALVAVDIPALDASKITTGTIDPARLPAMNYVKLAPAASTDNVVQPTGAATFGIQVASVAITSPRGIVSSQHNDGTEAARYLGYKSRGTYVAPTVIVTGDKLLNLVGAGYDGSSYLEMGAISIEAEGTIASTRVPTRVVFSTATNAAPSVLTERMRIDSAGKVGIGQTAPVASLHIGAGTPYNTGSRSSVAILNAAVANSYLLTLSNSHIATTNDSAVLNFMFGTSWVPTAEISAIIEDAGTALTGLSFKTYSNYGTGLAERVHIGGNGLVTATASDANTNAIANILTLGHNTSGTPAAGFGTGLLFQGQSNPTQNRNMAYLRTWWNAPTDASRAAYAKVGASDAVGDRDAISWGSDGSQALLSFYNVATPIARQVLATGAGHTVDDVIAALQALGLVKQA